MTDAAVTSGALSSSMALSAAATTAAMTAATVPTTRPTRALPAVTRLELRMTVKRSPNCSPIASGLGTMNGLSPSTTTASCHSASATSPKTTGATIVRTRVEFIGSQPPALPR
jgi:hypothetical protein